MRRSSSLCGVAAHQRLLVLLMLVLLLAASAATAGSNNNNNGGSSSTARKESYWTREVVRVHKYTAEKYMQRMAARPDVSTLPFGVLVSFVERGHGDVAPRDDDACLIHYTAYFRFNTIWDDTRNFTRFSDGSYVVKGTPVVRRPRDMLPGVREAMKWMREGDRWLLYIPSELAYGMEGNATMEVPPYACVRYDVELIRCADAGGRNSSEIDPYLSKHLKQPIPSPPPKVLL